MNLVIGEIKNVGEIQICRTFFLRKGICFCATVYTAEQNPVTAKNKRYGLGQLSHKIGRRRGQFYNELMINPAFRTGEVNLFFGK